MHILDMLIGLYAPHTCCRCGDEGLVICSSCLYRLSRPAKRCYRCHVPARDSGTCPDCLPYGLERVVAVSRYDGAAKAVVGQLKFHRARSAAGSMSGPMALLCRGSVRPGTLFVPVPTASSRARTRGYDQAVLLARATAKQAGAMYAPLLVRTGKQRQVGADRQQRRTQMLGAYTVMRPERARGAHIILVDDVVTTGSTLEAAAQALRQAGAASVEAVVFAQA